MTDQHRTKPSQDKDKWLTVIVAFKIFKAALLFAIGFGALSLVHKDIAQTLTNWADDLSIDLSNHYIYRFFNTCFGLSDKELGLVGAGTFLYASLFLIEGIGLMFRKRWAEWFTVIVTASFLPLEIYEIAERATAFRIIALLANLAILIYLLIVLKRGKKKATASKT